MKEIESIFDLAKCTDVASLKELWNSYNDEIVKRAEENPLYAAILLKMDQDDDFVTFMALLAIGFVSKVRINELEENKND